MSKKTSADSPPVGQGGETFAQFMARVQGFWNAPAPQGVWRAVATLRGPGRSESAVEISWDNASAQALASQALGLELAELPSYFHAPRCARALLLGLAHQGCEAIGGASFAEAGSGVDSDKERPASESMTLRLIAFDAEDFAKLSVGLALCAQTLGAKLRCSDPAWEAEALDTAKRLRPQGWEPEPSGCFERALAMNFGLDCVALRSTHEGQTRALAIDARAGARALGAPLDASLATDAFGLGLRLIDPRAVLKALEDESGANPWGFRALGPWAYESRGADPRGFEREALAFFAARQEADLLAQGCAEPAPTKRSPRI